MSKPPKHSFCNRNDTFTFYKLNITDILQCNTHRENEKVKGNLAAVQRQRSASYYISALQQKSQTLIRTTVFSENSAHTQTTGDEKQMKLQLNKYPGTKNKTYYRSA